ncbi:MAG: hypothetical protein AUI14_16665 [Actinobacteria bacterium 13_2_20CM_2_71_6]|jgi:uncharacterized protein DUF1707|nr:MAG: hypothetical protein AUI14_16665 [Actinobacteria bacterium 13_2_20CM_2_71_6]
MSADIAGTGRVRTSDAEREQVAAILRAAVTEGRLTLQEGDERLGRTYEARYRDELAPLTTDLPSGGWEALARTPEALAAARRRLRRHGSIVVLVAGLLVGAWLLSGAVFFWPLFPILFLTFGLMRHARFVRSGYPWGWGRGPWGPNRRVWSR